MKNLEYAYEIAMYIAVGLNCHKEPNIKQLRIKAQELLALLQNAEGEIKL